MARYQRVPQLWPAWWYGPSGESAIFNSQAEVPHGWVDRPGKKFEPLESTVLDREYLVKQLEAKGIEINPTWGKAHLKKVLDDSSPSR